MVVFAHDYLSGSGDSLTMPLRPIDPASIAKATKDLKVKPHVVMSKLAQAKLPNR